MIKHNIPIENVITHKEMQRRYGNEEQQKNPKQCPGRLLSGFRGTMQDFNEEIKRCLVYGWLFEELLDEDTISKIPEIMETAQQRFNTKEKKKKLSLHSLGELKVEYLDDKELDR